MFIIRAPQYLAVVDFTLHYRRDGACSFLPMLHISWFSLHLLLCIYIQRCAVLLMRPVNPPFRTASHRSEQWSPR